MFRRSTSIKLFDLFGLRIGVDGSWFIVLFLMIFVLSGPFRDTLHSSDGVAYMTTVVSVLLLFGSLIVHELGHALAARRQGIAVEKIDLNLFGGFTQMSRDAASPGEDFKVAIAGPLATFGVILLCLAIDLPIVGPGRLGHAVVLDSTIRITPVLLSLSWLLLMNVLLLAFNILPAFPLDGGRVARSIVWRLTGDKRRGTVAASRLGQGLALLMGGIGLWWTVSGSSFGGVWLLALAYLMWQSCRAALAQSALTERIEGVRVADIMDTHPVAIPAQTPVTQAVDEYFDRYRQPWLPVIDDTAHLLGIARRERAQASIDGGEAWLTTAAVLETDGTPSWQVREDRPISELLASETLGKLGALVAVDAEGILRGVVTVDQVRRALATAFGRSMA
ncbi:MAG TPA: site-2 protease family protein [Solirubrobacteraceae bacterium]|nr:site-2 protease family protein [Solirubrobacteraceae bacterium]